MAKNFETEHNSHDLENTVVGVFDSEQDLVGVRDGLSSHGYAFEVLRGVAGREHLSPGSEGGIVGAFRSLASSFGDEKRIVSRLKSALDVGKLVVVVDTEGGDPQPAIEVLKSEGGSYLWDFETWTHTRVATESNDGADFEERIE